MSKINSEHWMVILTAATLLVGILGLLGLSFLHVYDYSVAVDSMSVSVNPNDAVYTAVEINNGLFFDEDISLRTESVSPHIHVNFEPDIIKKGGSLNSKVNVSIDKEATPGEYVIPIISSSSDGKEHKCTFKLKVPPDNALAVNSTKTESEVDTPVETESEVDTPVETPSTPKTGSIYVYSSPQGATIYLDGTLKNLVTPSTLTNVEPGSHEITLKLLGYDDYNKNLNVEAGRVTRISPSLNPLQTPTPTETETLTPTETEAEPATPSAEINDVWFDDNKTKNGVTIHVVHTLYNLEGKLFTVSALFYDTSNGEQLTDSNGKYGVDGKVEVDRSETAKYVKNSYSDFNLFIPHEELHLSSGTANIKFKVVIKYKDQILDTSDWEYITLVQN